MAWYTIEWREMNWGTDEIEADSEREAEEIFLDAGTGHSYDTDLDIISIELNEES